MPVSPPGAVARRSLALQTPDDQTLPPRAVRPTERSPLFSEFRPDGVEPALIASGQKPPEGRGVELGTCHGGVPGGDSHAHAGQGLLFPLLQVLDVLE